MVSKKRLEKFLGGDDLENDIVRHDPSLSEFTVSITPISAFLCSLLFLEGFFYAQMYYICLFLCMYFLCLDTAVSICDGSFSWEKDSEPLLKKYVASRAKLHILMLYQT